MEVTKCDDIPAISSTCSIMSLLY